MQGVQPQPWAGLVSVVLTAQSGGAKPAAQETPSPSAKSCAGIPWHPALQHPRPCEALCGSMLWSCASKARAVVGGPNRDEPEANSGSLGMPQPVAPTPATLSGAADSAQRGLRGNSKESGWPARKASQHACIPDGLTRRCHADPCPEAAPWLSKCRTVREAPHRANDCSSGSSSGLRPGRMSAATLPQEEADDRGRGHKKSDAND